jgi:hypothetical protein
MRKGGLSALGEVLPSLILVLGGDFVEGSSTGFSSFEIDNLFGFEDKAAGVVEIEVAGGGGAVGFLVSDSALEDVGVFGVVRSGGQRGRIVGALGEESARAKQDAGCALIPDSATGIRTLLE